MDKPPDPDSSSKLGWGMITLAWLLFMSLLYVFFDQLLERRDHPNQQVEIRGSTGATELVLRRDPSGHYLASGAINDRPVLFILDTGATLVSVPAHRASALGLVPGAHGSSQTANGEVEIRLTTIETLSLGPFRLRKVRAALNPGQNDDRILLGMSALKHLSFTQSGKTLILRPMTPDPATGR